MTHPLKTPSSQNLGLLFLRLPVGVLFFWQGFIKLHDQGLHNFVLDHLMEVPANMPPWFGHNFLLALPFAELAIGLALASGILTRTSGLIGSLLVSSFMIAHTGWRDSGSEAWPFHPDIVLLGATLLLFFIGGGSIGVDGWLGKRKGG